MDFETLIEKIKHGDIDYVKAFIRNHPDSVSQPDNLFGLTPLMQAIQYRKTNIVKLLLDGGADVNRRDELNGWTALHWSVIWNPEDVAILLQHPTIQVNLEDNEGQTPLHWACSRGHTDIVGLFINHIGIKPNVVDPNGDTPLHFAVQRKRYDVVTLMLSQDSLDLEIRNKRNRTPLLEAVSRGHLGIMQKVIARGANVNVVDNEGNNCLHLALETNAFDSEVEHMAILDKYLIDLQLRKEERFSRVVVACYLAHKGADFYCVNKRGRTPLDLIKKENVKETLKALFPQLCRYCQEKIATVTLQPCGHVVLCENCCSEMTFKKCPMCRQYTLSKTGFEKRTFEDKETQTLAEPIVCPKFDEKASQTLPEPVGRSRMFSEKEIQTEAEPVQITKFVQEALKTSQQIESPKLGEKDLLTVAQNLGKNWWQVGIFLGIKSIELEIIKCDNPLNTVEQSYQMLLRWATRCDPETNKLETLKESLKSGQCLTALVCLLNIK